MTYFFELSFQVRFDAYAHTPFAAAAMLVSVLHIYIYM